MRTIWKYTLAVADRQIIHLPANAELLSVQLQDGKPCLWAIVLPTAQIVEHRILMFGTGHPVQDEGQFLGTVQIGGLVLHVFTEVIVPF